MSLISEQPLLTKVGTLAQYKSELLNNPDCLFFFFNSSVIPLSHFGEKVQSLVTVALTQRAYHCVYYDTQQLNLQKGRTEQNVAMGVHFYHNYECRAVNDSLDRAKFVETLNKLSSLEEMSAARVKEKENPKPKEEAAKPTRASDYGGKQKDYSLECCVIL
ncbi:hypothetical protein GGI20_003910 [Coemansia sp. BCRC 34301]|nr:hypothetical protein GGI20_003910 [Coemansia sp. BCRC 34301]